MSPECHYILDCAVELGELTPLEARVLGSATPAACAFNALLGPEGRGQLPNHWLVNTARAYLNSLDAPTRHVWALLGLEGMQFGIQCFQERIEFAVQTKIQSDLGVRPRTELPFIQEMTGAFEEVLFSSPDSVTPPQVQAFADQRFGAARQRLQADLDAAADAVRWWSAGNEKEGRRIARALLGDRNTANAPTVRDLANGIATQPRKSVKRAMSVRRSARSAIKKAFKLLSRAGVSDNVRLLVHGHEVELSHPDSAFKFVLVPYGPGWLEERTARPGGHTPFCIKLLTKDDVYISQLCVIFDNTPVLDQLLALTLFIQSGEEETLLQKANWFGFADQAGTRALLAETAPSLLPKVPDMLPPSGQAAFAADEAQAAVERHWAPYRAPVRTWVGAWLSEVKSSASALAAATRPALSLAA